MIIADTSAILAAIDSSAAEHRTCVDLIERTNRPLVVSDMVVAEVDYLLTTRFGVATANRFLSDVVAGAFRLMPTDERDLDDAITVNARYVDQALGVTDCMNVVLASRCGTIDIFTLDERHFRVVEPLHHGDAFRLWPTDGAEST